MCSPVKMTCSPVKMTPPYTYLPQLKKVTTYWVWWIWILAILIHIIKWGWWACLANIAIKQIVFENLKI